MSRRTNRGGEGLTASNDAELIACYIELAPRNRSRAEARLVGSGVPVWAIVGQYQATGRDAAYVAESYQVPLAAVQAALAYYRQNMAVIEDRLEANAV